MKLREKTFFKVVAFLLFCVLASGAFVCALGYAMAWDDGMYDHDPISFEETSFCGEFIYNHQMQVIHGIWGNDNQVYGLPDYSNANFTYRIYNSDDRLVEDTTTDQSVLVRTVYSEQYGLGGNWVEFYVNYPIAKGEPAFGYYQSYEILLCFSELFLPVGIGAAVLAMGLFLWLLSAAGRQKGGEIALRGLNRLPLDILAAALFLGFIGCGAIIGNFFSFNRYPVASVVMLWALVAVMAGLALGLFMTLAARLRVGKWWKNSLVYWVLNLCLRFLRWCKQLALGFINALPLVWKCVVAYVGVLLVNFFMTVIIANAWNWFPFFLLLMLFDAAGLYVVVRLTLQLRALQKAGRSLAAGDMSADVDTKKLWFDLKEHGENLNSMGLGISRAVNERMKSERFRTELITNVSHDLKTPLTSIVSYVDLLKKEEIDNPTAKEYIDVLDRQSARLKKLTEDLVEASKASAGVLSVSLERLDLGELLRQSTGEYAERFAIAQLHSVMNVPEEPCYVRADGRLLWRVLDNLLLNITKYALPGTRVYLDLMPAGGGATLTLKNISRNPLNIPAEELMERFVRGDSSRHSEGSGLGLNIAQSLMELMGGKLELALDGDLFKVTLTFAG